MANDPESAALKYAEENFSNWDYPSEMEIWVRKDDEQPWEKFEIGVEQVPSFYASKKK